MKRRGHEMVGMRAAEIVKDLVVVGDRAQIIATAARQAGLPAGSVHQVRTTEEATEYLRHHLSASDVVLVKGSRGMRMDRITTALEVAE